MFKSLVAFIKRLFSKSEYTEAEVAAIDNAIKMPEQKVEYVVKLPEPKKTLDEKISKIELPSYARGRKLPPKAKRQFVDEAKRRNNNKQPSEGFPVDNAVVQGAVAAAMFAGVSSAEDDPMVKEYVYMGDGMMEEVIVPRSEAQAQSLHEAYSPTVSMVDVTTEVSRSESTYSHDVYTPTYDSSSSDSYSSCDSSSSYSSCD